MKTEIWKDILGYEGLYQISNSGRVKSLAREVPSKNSFRHVKERVLKPGKRKDGYLYIDLSHNSRNKKKYVHRLVAFAFIENIDNKPQVNHINGDKSDNRIENLEWATGNENQKHAFMSGLNKGSKPWIGKFGKDHHSSKTVIQMTEEGNSIAEFESAVEASKVVKLNPSNISAVCRGEQKSAGGFKWKYKS